MGYKECLEKAGAKVIDFKEFGSYQGTWLAFVEYKGEIGIVEGSYGSCSSCDAFQSEFNYYSLPTIEDGKYYRNGDTWNEEDECTEGEYKVALKSYEDRFIEFGRSYLETDSKPNLYNKQHYELRLSKLDMEDCFDVEESEYIKWAISKLSITPQ